MSFWYFFMLATLNISLSLQCQNDYNIFTKTVDKADIDNVYSPLLTTLSDVTVYQCLQHMVKNPLLLWFLYNPERRECVTSQCWNIPVQDQQSNNVYFKRKGKPIVSCSDVKTAVPEAGDGEYWIYPDAPTFLGCPTKIYCHNMATGSPSEFVSLSVINTGDYPLLHNAYCNNEVTYMNPGAGENWGTTNFSKIRVDIQTMSLIQDDYTFASSNGTKNAYGFAKDCYTDNTQSCGPKGTFNINTVGTGMTVDPEQTWEKYGYLAFNHIVTRSADGVQIDLLCGGSCGGCRPVGGLYLHRNPQEVVDDQSATYVDLQTCCN